MLWAPYLQRDSRVNAQRASLYMADKRVHHFWDLWRFGTRVYSEQMHIAPRFAWDMLVFYKPLLMWRDNPPEPTLWMHGSAEYGPPYNKHDLESGLKAWLER